MGLRAEKNAKRGAPKGHWGNTLVLGKADFIIPVVAECCCNCQSKNIKKTGYVKKRKIVDIIKPKIIINEYLQNEYLCLDCRTLTLASQKDIPETGIYSKNIQSIVNYLKFKGRMPHEILVDFMNNYFLVPMTRPTCLAITRRASKKLEYKYDELGVQIKNETLIQPDETSLSVNGINHWIWVFCNSLITFFKINKERGGDIVEKTLGKDFKGKICSDGWRTYTTYCVDNNVVHQRCWAHGWAEVKFESQKKHPELCKWYHNIYMMVKDGKNCIEEKNRLDIYKKCKAELERWIICAKAHTNLRKLANKIENGGDNWFNCILYPDLPIDNNEAERSIRPFVIIRKIIGCLRSEIGKKNYEVMMSLISTWEKQDKNVFHMLDTLL